MGSDSIPQNSFGWEYKPRSGLCTHAFYHTDLKDPDIHVLDGCMRATKTHQACTMKTEWDYLSGWIEKKRSHTQRSHPKWWTPEIQLGTQKKIFIITIMTLIVICQYYHHYSPHSDAYLCDKVPHPCRRPVCDGQEILLGDGRLRPRPADLGRGKLWVGLQGRLLNRPAYLFALIHLFSLLSGGRGWG